MGSTEWSGPRGNPLNKMRVVAKTLAAFFILFSVTGTDAQKYYGKRIGQLSQLQHSVKGEVYAVDSRTIHIKGFSYDGTAPDAFFYAGRSGSPSENGVIIPDENGRRDPLGAYSNRDVTITLPDGMTLKDVAWLSVWCRAFSIDFGSLKIPRALEYPRPQKIDGFPTLEHAVKSDKIVVVDAQTFLIPDFHYDGEAPDAFFWVGRGTKPGSNGIAVPDENGGREPIRRYSGKTIVITLPDSMTVFDIDYLGVWCKSFSANFGHVIIPKGLNIPPSLKMLGVAPQKLSSGHPNIIPSSFNHQLPSEFQGQSAFEHPSNAAQNFFAQNAFAQNSIAQNTIAQNSIAQGSFVQPQTSFFQQPTPNNLQLSSPSLSQPQVISQFANLQQSSGHPVFQSSNNPSLIQTPSFENNFNANLIPQNSPSKPISHAELDFSDHRFSSPSSQFGQTNVPSTQFNHPSSIDNAPSHFNEPAFVNAPSQQLIQQPSFGNVPSHQFNQQSSFGNVPSHQFSQQSSFGNVPSHQFNQQTSFGNVPSHQFNQQPSFGNVPSHQFNQQSSFGNAPSQRFSQPSSFNIQPTSHINQLSTVQNVPSQQFIHQSSPLSNAVQANHNQQISSFISSPSTNFNQQASFGNIPTTNVNQPSFANVLSQLNSRTSFANDPSFRNHQHPSRQEPKDSNSLFIHNQFHSHLSPKIVRDINLFNSDSGANQETALHQPINTFNSLLSTSAIPSNRQNIQNFKTHRLQSQTEGHVSRPSSISKTKPINHFTITDNRPSFFGANNNFNSGIIDFNRNNVFRPQSTLKTDQNRNNLRAIRGDTLQRKVDTRTTALPKNPLVQTHETESGNSEQSATTFGKTGQRDKTIIQKDSKSNAFTVHRLEPQAFDKQKPQPIRRHQLSIISLPLANPTSQSALQSFSRTQAAVKNSDDSGSFIPSSPLRNHVSDGFDGSFELASSSSSFALTSPEENLESPAKGKKVQKPNDNQNFQGGTRISSRGVSSLNSPSGNIRQRSPLITKDVIKRSETTPEHVIYNEESANTNSYSKVIINNGGHKMSYTIYV